MVDYGINFWANGDFVIDNGAVKVNHKSNPRSTKNKKAESVSFVEKMPPTDCCAESVTTKCWITKILSIKARVVKYHQLI